MACCLRPWWTTCPGWRPRRVGGAADRASCTPTRPTTVRTTAPTCGSVASPRGLPGVGGSHRPPLAGIAGRASGRCPGWACIGGWWGGRGGAVPVELLSAVAGALGARLGQILRVRAVGLCADLLHPALAGHNQRHA